MNKRITLILLIITIFSISKADAKNKGIFMNITAAEAYNIINSSANYILIDVRTKAELLSGMIDDAVHIDYHDRKFKRIIKKMNRKKKYIIYCEVGWRSKRTLKLMKKYKFIEAYNLLGGIVAWKDKKLPVIYPVTEADSIE